MKRLPKHALRSTRVTEAKHMALDGYGWEDLRHICGLSEYECKLIVSAFGDTHGTAVNRSVPGVGSGSKTH